MLLSPDRLRLLRQDHPPRRRRRLPEVLLLRSARGRVVRPVAPAGSGLCARLVEVVVVVVEVEERLLDPAGPGAGLRGERRELGAGAHALLLLLLAHAVLLFAVLLFAVLLIAVLLIAVLLIVLLVLLLPQGRLGGPGPGAPLVARPSGVPLGLGPVVADASVVQSPPALPAHRAVPHEPRRILLRRVAPCFGVLLPGGKVRPFLRRRRERLLLQPLPSQVGVGVSPLGRRPALHAFAHDVDADGSADDRSTDAAGDG